MKLEGWAHKYGADVNTDLIIPARCLQSDDHAFWMAHCMEDIDTEFVNRVKPGDFIVATTNFGCGSSREQAPIVIKDIGVSCVIASSFARIFFRNAINVGLAAIEVDTTGINEGDSLSIDLNAGRLIDHANGIERHFEPLPPIMTEILADGGLIAHIKKHGDFNL